MRWLRGCQADRQEDAVGEDLASAGGADWGERFSLPA
jgi:hypothetical protein